MTETIHKEMVTEWDHAHRYSPAPRHRRRIILNLLKKLDFQTCLDAGCAQPYLLNKIMANHHVQAYGCDYSTNVIAENKMISPHCEFQVLDIVHETWPDQKQFDVVISSEVIEHISDWRLAIKNLAGMSKRYLLITVPSGKIRKIDTMVGHTQHFAGEELIIEMKKNGFECIRIIRHGFPVHSIYKYLINVNPNKIFHAFQASKRYTLMQKLISHALYFAFYINYLFPSGEQLIILAERKAEVT